MSTKNMTDRKIDNVQLFYMMYNQLAILWMAKYTHRMVLYLSKPR